MSDFSKLWRTLYNAARTTSSPSLSLPGCSWPILRPWQDRSQHRFAQKRVPEKQLVQTWKVGPSPSRGQVNPWWSQIWHSLLHTRWAHHSLHALTWNLSPCKPCILVCTWFTHCLHPLLFGAHIGPPLYQDRSLQWPVTHEQRNKACQWMKSIRLDPCRCYEQT